MPLPQEPPLIRAAYDALLATGQVVSVPVPAHGSNAAMTPAPPTPSIRPEDTGVGILLTILDLPPLTPVVATATATVIRPSAATAEATPLSGFVLAPEPPVTNGAALFVVGDGLQEEGAEYLLDITIAVGGTGESVGALTIALPCGV